MFKVFVIDTKANQLSEKRSSETCFNQLSVCGSLFLR